MKRMSGFLRKNQRPDQASEPELLPDVVAAEYPALTEFLVLSEWEDGSTRVPGTLLLCTEGGRWRAWLHDRDGDPELSCWVSASTWAGLMRAVEDGLRQGCLDWRVHRKPPGQNRGRRG